jgi:hypothetical protein
LLTILLIFRPAFASEIDAHRYFSRHDPRRFRLLDQAIKPAGTAGNTDVLTDGGLRQWAVRSRLRELASMKDGEPWIMPSGYDCLGKLIQEPVDLDSDASAEKDRAPSWVTPFSLYHHGGAFVKAVEKNDLRVFRIQKYCHVVLLVLLKSYTGPHLGL